MRHKVDGSSSVFRFILPGLWDGSSWWVSLCYAPPGLQAGLQPRWLAAQRNL